MLLMGVDVGTTGVKAAVFDEDGEMRAYGFHEYDIICERPGYAQQDAEMVWRYTKEVMACASSQVNGEISAVSLSTQGDAVIPIDSNGDALCLAQLGMDYRATAEAAAISAKLGEATIFKKTGIRPHPLNSLMKIMWFEHNMPELHEKLWKYTTYSDYILLKLGSDESVIDLTMASRTMCLDLQSCEWSREILSAAGLEERYLSKPVPSGTVVGKMRSGLSVELNIRSGAVLVAGGHDQTCAALGAGVIKESMALDSHGTAEVLSTAFNAPRLDDIMFSSNYPCYRHVMSGMFFTFALNHVGGLLLKWYRDNLGGVDANIAGETWADSYEKIVALMPKGPSPILVLPHFNGSGAPTFDAQSRGAIIGLTMNSTRHDIAKGIMDATAYELRNNIETMRSAGIDIHKLICVGGGARSTVGLQLKADITGLSITTLRVREAACLGAAILAGVGVCLYTDASKAVSCIGTDRTYWPDEEMHKRYNEKYEVYSGLYGALKETNAKIKQW